MVFAGFTSLRHHRLPTTGTDRRVFIAVVLCKISQACRHGARCQALSPSQGVAPSSERSRNIYFHPLNAVSLFSVRRATSAEALPASQLWPGRVLRPLPRATRRSSCSMVRSAQAARFLPVFGTVTGAVNTFFSAMKYVFCAPEGLRHPGGSDHPTSRSRHFQRASGP